jgi:N-acetylneuraminic acid mutarotase
MGGTTSPNATNALPDLLKLDFDNLSKGWQALPPCPGSPRMLAVAAVLDGELYVAGGCALKANPEKAPQRTYLKDAYKFTPGKGWAMIAGMPNPVAAAPTPAPVFGKSFYVIGGDDGSLVSYEPKAKHPGFPRRILRYDTRNNRWTNEPDAPVARATLSTARWNGYEVLVSGEARPGVRSPEVWAVSARRGQ